LVEDADQALAPCEAEAGGGGLVEEAESGGLFFFDFLHQLFL